MLLRAMRSVMCKTSSTVSQISDTELFLIGKMLTRCIAWVQVQTFRSLLFWWQSLTLISKKKKKHPNPIHTQNRKVAFFSLTTYSSYRNKLCFKPCPSIENSAKSFSSWLWCWQWVLLWTSFHMQRIIPIILATFVQLLKILRDPSRAD